MVICRYNIERNKHILLILLYVLYYSWDYHMKNENACAQNEKKEVTLGKTKTFKNWWTVCYVWDLENLPFLSPVSLSATSWLREREQVTELILPQLQNDGDSSEQLRDLLWCCLNYWVQCIYQNACHFLIAGWGYFITGSILFRRSISIFTQGWISST